MKRTIELLLSVLEPFSWWILILLGLFMTAFSAWILFKTDIYHRDVKVKTWMAKVPDSAFRPSRRWNAPATTRGPSGFAKEASVLVLGSMGIVIVIFGIVGVFYPSILIWAGVYSKAYETSETVIEITWFLIFSIALTAVCIYLFARGIVGLAKGKSDHEDLWASLIFISLLILYYSWIHFTDRWDELLQPLADFFSLLFGG